MGEWVQGKIMGVRGDGTYDVLYDHAALGGESEVPLSRLRPVDAGAPASAAQAAATPGTTATASSGPVAASPAVAAAAAASASSPKRRGPKRIGGAQSLGLVSAGAPNDGSGFTAVKITDGFSPGDAVEVRYRGKTWRPATVTGVREEGSYDVDYGCGETERGVPPPLVRTPQAPTSPQRAAASSAARRANETEAERAARKAEKRRRRAEKERLRQQRGDASFPAAEVATAAAPAGDAIEGLTHREAVDRVRELERVCKRQQKKISKQERIIESLREKVVEWQQKTQLPSKELRAQQAAGKA
jgi:hypothetical protein